VPQPIEMRVHVLRAVKDKLPRGSCVARRSALSSLRVRPARG
jgi:hypothetical protein